LLGSIAAGLLALAGLAFLAYPSAVDQELNDLKSGTADARRQALVALAQADVDGSRRSAVTAALEPLLFEGDVRHDLSPDLVLRAYLHWAGPDNVPAMTRMVQSPTFPDWDSKQSVLVIQTLGKLQDPRAAAVLAERLTDPALRDQAVDALRLIGPPAENAVLDYVFDPNPDTRLRASQLLAGYGAAPKTIATVALGRLQSNSPDAQRSAAVWFAENPPTDAAQQAEVARSLARLLDDLSPKVDALALHALKLWATKDCLPQLVAFARRQDKGGACPPELIDVLARFPDESAAGAIALRLKDPPNRSRAVEALAKLGPVATRAVLGYINHPDADVRKAARSLCRQLKVPAAQVLDQTLVDVADARKARSRTALQNLAGLRPDGASRPRVSQALNSPLLDADPAVRADALAAVHIWGTKENTTTLLTALAKFPGNGSGRDPCILDALPSLQDPAAAPTLAEGLTQPQEVGPAVKALTAMGPAAEKAVIPYLESTSPTGRYAACWVLTEIGTQKSLSPLEAAASKWFADAEFYQRTRLASEMILARK
jgi:HEAT repeat protein